MASPHPIHPPPSSRPQRRQQAPSLDVMTAQGTPSALRAEDTDLSTAVAMQESRSSSSTNSPAPNDIEESDFFLVPNDSQSSLGVPNIQDMQVNDDDNVDSDTSRLDEVDPCIPPVNRLPNEILISVFARLGSASDQLHCMLTCKRWARNAVDLLWHRPACTNWPRHESICQTLIIPTPYFSYKDFIKRLNLASIADQVSDGSVTPLAMCNRIERLTLTNCKRLTDTGLIALVENSNHLLALDMSGDDQVTEATIFTIAEHCKRLQGLNVSGCTRISNEGMIRLAESCKYIKRIKLNDCSQLTDDAVLAFARHCPNILEIDLHQCRQVTNQSVTELLAKGQALRELRLANCELIDDNAFLSLAPERVFEHLRILDLTSCVRLTDRAVQKIIDVAPRLRNLVLAKCRNITDAAVQSIARLGKNLHYVHLGHCGHITDDAVKKLVHSCNRIRYIDLGCCTHLTDESVTRLATLPKLKRIGLVKCSNITDESVYALAKANQRSRLRRDADGNIMENRYHSYSSLERVHLSYCTNLGIRRDVFCVFSGDGVTGLREHLNRDPVYAIFRDRATITTVSMNRRPPPSTGIETIDDTAPQQQPTFGTPEPFIADDDDDGMEDLSEMAVDTELPNQGMLLMHGTHSLPSPIPIPGPSTTTASTLVPTAPPFTPAAFLHSSRFPVVQPGILPPITSIEDSDGTPDLRHYNSDAMQPPASAAPVGMSFYMGEMQPGPSTATGSTRSIHASGSGATATGVIVAQGASRAPLGMGGVSGPGTVQHGGPSNAAPPVQLHDANTLNDASSSRSSTSGDP
ncbi:ubiquitin ligase complex f-box protein [Grosmannia clavigera kw1407]|uniref:Ubiquitin ligase complex f-box protein n=1 Tax=Grosmannia clavigera (strain kw1407 / UAMH 11150) TaxID=655863 RepID=F0XP23_GROCL|nr:ubiquitin ligase complex f-box protein [Grosmannia clavigera kw1407]EFX00708.1 ubiquitin ligase complex f-box protein [Grosmannia clavigera kw1407]